MLGQNSKEGSNKMLAHDVFDEDFDQDEQDVFGGVGVSRKDLSSQFSVHSLVIVIDPDVHSIMFMVCFMFNDNLVIEKKNLAQKPLKRSALICYIW